ncbi:MAG TPA: hypothetical protein VK912_18180 [Longimicrobiales bacterium]|nr:hypothetical protein [Longimicrobiales bacterium]
MDSTAQAAGLLVAHRATFRTFAVTVVPEMAAFDDAAWADVERTVTHALSQRPAAMRRQLAVFLRVIENLPRLRYGRAFSSLPPSERASVLHRLERAPLKLIRRGIWGLRTLVLMGCYTRGEMMDGIGYRAHARGWAARMAPS